MLVKRTSPSNLAYSINWLVTVCESSSSLLKADVWVTRFCNLSSIASISGNFFSRNNASLSFSENNDIFYKRNGFFNVVNFIDNKYMRFLKNFKAPYIGWESPLTYTTRLLLTVNPKDWRDKIFKSGSSKFLKGCLPQILLGPLLNTLCLMKHWVDNRLQNFESGKAHLLPITQVSFVCG